MNDKNRTLHRELTAQTKQPASRRLSTARIVNAAMFAALTLLATSVLKIQTPTFGYIHIGDAFVLLSGLFLGPLTGGLAAGIGSGLSDLLGGYVIWVPGTFAIKFLTAAAAALVFRAVQAGGQKSFQAKPRFPVNNLSAKTNRLRKGALSDASAVILAGIVGELIMIAGYFFYNVLVIAFSGGGFSPAGIASAFSLSLAEIPFNAVQGCTGIVLASLLQPVFARIRRSASFLAV
ncbi:MAG: ECF transporter S component [Eubacterium sp.]|nr:ECF transporter S component [Eubacterium sp.]